MTNLTAGLKAITANLIAATAELARNASQPVIAIARDITRSRAI